MQAVRRDEFETVKQLLASAARGIAELKQTQQENVAQVKKLGERIDEFVFQVNRLVSNQQQEISQIKVL